MKDIIILGIESSCDETSVAIVKNGREVLSNVINTQISIHELYGGVVPEIASRNHVENISPVMKEALKEANCMYIWPRTGWCIISWSILCKSIKLCSKQTTYWCKSHSRTYCCKLYNI